ncbi:endonuclease domain-containing protein [Amycolatopsis sp. lyj-108]|uniref:endonuclease domain-containing protein n=1 Tax=Amycolatopsis sp. lyj-108 TaxID=2789286 RepID=UPI0039785E3C
MSKSHYAEVADFSGPFLGSRAISEGDLTRSQLRSGPYNRLFQNVYVPIRIPQDHVLRCKAAILAAPAGAVLTGCSAATVRGFPFALDSDPVEFVIPEEEGFHFQRGMHLKRSRLIGGDFEPWRDGRIASPLRMTMDILANTRLHRSFPRVVGLVDALLHTGFVEREQLENYFEHRHDHGIVRARKALALSDARAESIPESEVRIWLRSHDIEAEPQVEVYRDRRFLGRLDLAIRKAKLAIEYDGAWHLEGEQPLFDAERRALMEADGWRFVVITKEELYGDPKGMVARVKTALQTSQRNASR